MLIRLRFFIILILIVTLSACGGGVGSVISSVATGGTTSSDTGSSATSTAEAAGDAETQLFDSGPVDLPVTIAKLESPDATKIIVSTEAITPSQNAPLDSRFSTTDPTVAYTVTGAEGAIHDPDTTPYVYLENVNNSTDEFCEVEDDGSFSCAILGDLSDDLRLYASTTSDTDTAQMSPPLFIRVDSLGVTTIADTNSTNISADFSLHTDSRGNYYLVVVIDGRSNFYRRNVDGTLLQTIWTDDDAEGQYIPTKIESIMETQNDTDKLFIYFFDQNGQLYEVELTETSASIAARFVYGGGRPGYTITPTLTAVDFVNEQLSAGDPAELEGYRFQPLFDNTSDLPSHFVVYYPASVAQDGTVAKVITTNPDGVNENDLTYEVSDYDLQSVSLSFNSNSNGMARITDPSVTGCSEQCLAVVDMDDSDTGNEFPTIDILNNESNLPADVQKVEVSRVDQFMLYLISSEGLYEYNSKNVGDKITQRSQTHHPLSLAQSKDGSLIAGCCRSDDGDFSICAYNQDENDFDLIWEEDGDLCNADNPPDVDEDNNIHFYDSLGQHRAIYQESNAAVFEDVHHIPPLAMGACGYDINEPVTAELWADFCSCWPNDAGYPAHPVAADYDPNATCDSLLSLCQANNKTGKLHLCYYYLLEAYSDTTLNSCGPYPWLSFCAD